MEEKGNEINATELDDTTESSKHSWEYDFDEEYGVDGEFIEETPTLSREEQEAEVKRTLTELVVGIVISGLLIFLIGNLILSFSLFFSLGLLVGIVMAIVMSLLMYRSVLIATEYDEHHAKGYMKRAAMLRLGIMIVVMGLSLWLLSTKGFFGAFFGLISLKFSALFWPLLHKYIFRTKK